MFIEARANPVLSNLPPSQDWSLMCPSDCPGLDECWGEEFEKLYTG